MDTLQNLTLKLASTPGVSGCESPIVNLAAEWLAPLGTCETTPLGSLICKIKQPSPGRPHLVLNAHLDQIGLVVTQIEESGFLRIAPVGGCDRAVLPSAQIQVHTKDAILPGVVCTIPPHLSTGDKTLPKVEELAIDIGFSAEEAKKRVAPGDRVTCVSTPLLLKNGRISAQSLDDRAGCAVVMWAAKALAQLPLQCGLSLLLSTHEEVGEQGAQTGVRMLMPTHSIIVDVSFAHTPDAQRSQCGVLDGGAMLGCAPILDNGMFTALRKTAEQEKIPYQLEIMSGATGTDADKIAVCGAGVRCAMLSIPLRYMHTPVEVVTLSDLEAVANLITAYAQAEFGGAAQ